MQAGAGYVGSQNTGRAAAWLGIPAKVEGLRDPSKVAELGEHDGMANDDLIVEVLDYLVGARPLIGGDDQVDIATTEAIERPVGHARRVNAKLS
jgi:hypothetical protein